MSHPPSLTPSPSLDTPPPLPRWVQVLLDVQAHGCWLCQLGACLVALGVFLVDYSTGPAILLSVLYVPPLCVIALLTRTRWPGYAAALGLTVLVYVAYEDTAERAAGAALVTVVAHGAAFLGVVAGTHLLRRMIRILHDYLNLLEEARAAAWALAVTDPLTGLANRRSFDARLEEEIRRCSREGRPVAVLMLDVDQFKEINDRSGHEVGDAVLRAVATSLRAGLRVGDLAARVGGDEFAVVLPETDGAQAQIVAAKLRAHLSAGPPGTDSPVPVQVSIGHASMQITLAPPVLPSVLPTAALLKEADTALYQEKRRRSSAL